MSLYDTGYKIINYFHKDDKYNRVTLGLTGTPLTNNLMKWRFADVLLIGVIFVVFLFTYYIPPFQRQFYVNDLTISHPFAEHERVTALELFIYAVWIPLIVIGVIGLVITKPANKIYVTYISILGLLISVFTTSIVTDILKNFIGRHRPDFLARCMPKDDAPIDVLVTAKEVCTTDNIGRLMDGFRTTPSGHSSISFAGLGYTALWLNGQLITRHYTLGAWRSIVACSPYLGASLIALSRTEDYRHHFVDIILGSILGIVIGLWSYFRYFPKLTTGKCYEPTLLLEEEKEEITYDRIGEEDV